MHDKTLFFFDRKALAANNNTEITSKLIDRLSQRVLDDDVKQAYYMDKGMWENVCVMFSRLTRGNAIKFEHIEGRKEKRDPTHRSWMDDGSVRTFHRPGQDEKSQ